MSTLRQLAYFVAVVDEGSFTRAAKRLFVAQPSLSQQVRSLESEVGTALIERLPRSVKLTSAGRAFLPHARIAVKAADEAMHVARASLAEGGEIEICTTRSVAVGLLPEALRRWYEKYPRTRVRLFEYGAGNLEEHLRDGVGDLAIGPRPTEWSGPVADLGWEEFVLVLPQDDDLAGHATMPLTALRDREWVMFDQAIGLTDLITRACVELGGYEPRRGLETPQVETAARLAGIGIGPTLVPRSILPVDLRAAVVTPDPPIGRQLSVFARTTWEPLAGCFVNMLQELPRASRPAGSYAFQY